MTEPLITLESSEMTKPSVTDHGALTGLGDNDHPQYFNPLSNNGVIKYNNQNNPDFRYDYNSSTSGATWQRIAIVTISTGTYAGANFEVELIHAGGSWGQITPTARKFYIRTTRSGSVQDDYNNAAVVGPSTDYCRVVKTATGVYEIQIRTISDYTWMTAQIRPIAASTSRATVTYGFATGNTTGTIYSSLVPYVAPVFYPLVTSLTSASFDGDARSTTAKTEIDLASSFSGMVSNARAVLARIVARDSGSAAAVGNVYFALSGTSGSSQALVARLDKLPNDYLYNAHGIVPCNTSGNIYYQVEATGTGTLDTWIQINGYWI